MDGSRFDSWTRRRFGLLAGGLAATLFGGTPPQAVGAKKKKKRKHKKQATCALLGDVCSPTSSPICCVSLACKSVAALGGDRCCKDIIGTPCAAPTECCSGICLDRECQPDICKEIGQFCGTATDCCSRNCNAGLCAA